MMSVYAHRGASAVEPENTLRAFRRALELGVDGFELDVQVTADRIPVVLHDRSLQRTTDRDGAVDLLTLEELRRADAGQGERIPTLAEVLQLAGDAVHLDIEVKQGGIEPEVLGVLAGFPGARWAISSFDWTSLQRVRALSTTAELWVLAVSVSPAVLATAADLRATAVSLAAESYTEATAAELKAASLHAVVWTINDLTEARRVRDLGAFGLCTDDPESILNGLGRASGSLDKTTRSS
jgi:glycerophosphoryl diester phosphodiesterase